MTILCRLRKEEREQNENIFRRRKANGNVQFQNTAYHQIKKMKKYYIVQLKGTGNIHFIYMLTEAEYTAFLTRNSKNHYQAYFKLVVHFSSFKLDFI